MEVVAVNTSLSHLTWSEHPTLEGRNKGAAEQNKGTVEDSGGSKNLRGREWACV